MPFISLSVCLYQRDGIYVEMARRYAQDVQVIDWSNLDVLSGRVGG